MRMLKFLALLCVPEKDAVENYPLVFKFHSQMLFSVALISVGCWSKAA